MHKINNKEHMDNIPQLTSLVRKDIIKSVPEAIKIDLDTLSSDMYKFLCTANPEDYPLRYRIQSLMYDDGLDRDEATMETLEDYSISQEFTYFAEDIRDSLGDTEAECILYNALDNFCDYLSSLDLAYKCESLVEFIDRAFCNLLDSLFDI